MERSNISPTLSNMHNKLHFGQLFHWEGPKKNNNFRFIFNVRSIHDSLRTFRDARPSQFKYSYASRIRSEWFRLGIHLHSTLTRCLGSSLHQGEDS
jgi:hypothetical protein